MGASAAVSTQTCLVNYMDALKKAKYVQGAKSSFDATTNAVSKLLDRFKLFGACAAALKSALTVPEGGPKAATVAKEVLLSTQPAALWGAPPFPLPKAGQPRTTRKRALATMQSSEPESTADKDFVVSDDHTDSSSDSEEKSVPGSGTAPDQVNLTDQDDDKDDDSDDEVTHFDCSHLTCWHPPDRAPACHRT